MLREKPLSLSSPDAIIERGAVVALDRVLVSIGVGKVVYFIAQAFLFSPAGEWIRSSVCEKKTRLFGELLCVCFFCILSHMAAIDRSPVSGNRCATKTAACSVTCVRWHESRAWTFSADIVAGTRVNAVKLGRHGFID